MVIEFAPHQYVDVDKIQALRWIKAGDVHAGIIVLSGDKIVVTEKEEYDAIESAYIWKNKTYMVDDRLKKVRWIKGEQEDVS